MFEVVLKSSTSTNYFALVKLLFGDKDAQNILPFVYQQNIQ